jgi:hypothetical protein
VRSGVKDAKTNSHHSSSGCLTHPQDATSPPPALEPTASASHSGARPESPEPGAVERGVGRERRGRNLRPLPRPMDGSNSAIGGYLSQAQALSASSSKVCSQKNPWRVRLRQGHASRRSSRLPNAIRHLHSRHGVIAEGVQADTLKAPHQPSEHHPCRATH